MWIRPEQATCMAFFLYATDTLAVVLVDLTFGFARAKIFAVTL
jgi:hypothetical protein